MPYEEPKVAEAIRQAGVQDRYLAEDLAGVVTLYLERTHEGTLPTSEDVQRAVAKVLTETSPGLFPAVSLMVESRDGVSRWDRERIAAALRREARVDAERAGAIAEAVERRVLSMGRPRVSTALIRELVNQELLTARGDVLGQIVVGLPKYDVSQLMAAPRGLPDADELSRRVGEAALQQYALQELFSPEAAAAHLEGRLHIHHVEHPLKLYWWAPDLASLAASSARELTARLASLTRWAGARVAGGIELAPLNDAYARWEADDELQYLDLDPAAHIGVSIGASAKRWLGRPGLTVLAPPSAFRNAEDLELLKTACAHPPVRFVLGGATSRFAAPCLSQAVTINLPQAVYRAGEAGLDAELERVVELVVRAHLDKRRLLKRFEGGLGPGLPDAADLRYAVGVCGLAEAARLLWDAELGADEAAARGAFRVLSYLFALIKQASEVHRISMSLEDLDGEDAAARFSRIDAQIYPQARDARYTPGAHVGPGGAERVRVESRFHTLIPSQAVVLPGAADLFAQLMRLQAETLAGQLFAVRP